MGTPSRVSRCTHLLDFTIKAIKELREAVRLSAKQLGKANPFLTTLSPLLSDVENRLKRLQKDEGGDPGESIDEERLFKLSGVLERLAGWPEGLNQPSKSPFKRTNYPHLDGLVRCISSSQQATREKIKKLATSQRDSVSRQRGNFQTSFTNFANSKSNERGPPLSDVITLSAHPTQDEDGSTYLRVLHSILCRVYAQGCGDFKANVALTRVQRMEYEEGKDVVPFNLFFLHRHPPDDCMWKETRIRVFLPSDTPRPLKIKFETGTKISPEEFCEIIRHQAYGNIILNAWDDHLFYVRPHLNFEKLKRLFLLKASSVSLATVLEKRKLEGDNQLKLLLSYLLAKAVWQFYDSEWMTSNWTKHTIHFMRECLSGSPEPYEILTLIHKPFFATELRPPYSPQDGSPLKNQAVLQRFPSKTHLHPKILALGIILLEIELGEGVERHRPEESLDHVVENVDHLTAGGITSSEAWKRRKTFRAVKEIIEICLKPDIGRLGLDEDHVRENLYTYVIAPLGKLFEKAWSRDQEPEDFNPSPISFKPTDIPSDELGFLDYEAADSGNQQSALSNQNSNSDQVPEALSVLNTESNLNPGPAAAQGFPRAYESFGIAKEDEDRTELNRSDDPAILLGRSSKVVSRSEPQTWVKELAHLSERTAMDPPVSIAVLDTGCNLDAPIFLDSGQEDRVTKHWKDWVDNSIEPKDEDGHGTRIVSLLLRIAPKAKIHVARVAKNREHLQKAGNAIAEAIQYAATSCDVDIISMSFGFPNKVASIEQAIIQAKNKRGNSPIFLAAARNDGSNRDEMFPAFIDAVIPVRGTDATGQFVPLYDPDRSNAIQPAYGTLGKDVFCGWPEIPERYDSWMSGCSIATPILAAIAALIIQSVEVATFPFSKEQAMKVRSRKGITTVMHKISVPKGNNRFYVAPWNLFDENGTLKLSAVADTLDLRDY